MKDSFFWLQLPQDAAVPEFDSNIVVFPARTNLQPETHRHAPAIALFRFQNLPSGCAA